MFFKSSIPYLCRVVFLATCLGDVRVVGAGEMEDPPRVNLGLKGLSQYFQNIFTTELPFTNPDSVWDLDIHPKFRDFLDERYFRLPMELTYGVSDTLEGSVGFQPYVANPFRSGSFSRWGIVSLGFKKRLANFLDESWDFAYGAKVQVPVDSIPFVQVAQSVSRNNFTRTKPFVVVSKTIGDDERLRGYFNVSYDHIDRYFADPREHLEKPKSLFFFQPGVVFRPDQEWRYSLELRYLTSRLAGGHSSEWSLKPGIRWYPSDHTWLGKLPGDVSLGLTVEYFFTQLPENAHRDDVKVRLRVRWRWHRSNDASAH